MKSQNSKDASSTHSEAQTKSDVARREEEVLAFWREHDIFNKSVAKDAPQGDFVFYDGPPFATGLPHYGHILAGTIKDAIPRFWTMNGYRVRRKWGWDCHGLPLENIIEKRLGLATKRDIEALGVKQFNEAAREAVLEFADDWRRIIPRMGRWVDMDDDYKTMDSSYTESVWWVFKQLHEKGLVYEGFKSMHLCPRCGTTLSNFEVNLGYKDIKDIAVTVKLPLLDENGEMTDASLLVWTTTPWTLPGNFAAAVHKDYDYVEVEISPKLVASDLGDDGRYEAQEIWSEKIILAESRLQAVIDTNTYDIEVLRKFKGADLVGRSYVPPFDYYKDADIVGKGNAWKIYHADYVELGDEGTGAVHLAPAYGEEDMELAKREGIPVVHHVDPDGRFMPHITDLAGHLVKPKDDDESGVTHLDADIEIVKRLRDSGKLFKKENISHSYPHCWRCDTPLLNYATTSWFVKVTDIKDDLVAANKTVHWVPEHVGVSRFGKWLEGARDWAVSRQRYWGAPIPIWRNPKTKEYKVIGSLEELQSHVPHSGNRYFITRHGESAFNTKDIVSSGHETSNGLSEKGREQCVELADKLRKHDITRIYYSPLQRTRETAELVAKELGLKTDALLSDDRLLELRFGEFEGKHYDEYHAFMENGMGSLTKRPEGGEDWTELKQRLGAFIYGIEENEHDQNILIVSHNGPMQMLQSAMLGENMEVTAKHIDDDTYDLANAELRELSFTPMPHNDNYELDYHRPYIDGVTLVDEDGTELERVPDVFDCWFESGSMPYAETHYPFEHLDVADPKHGVRFPADFISESVDQTRGWFYSLMVLGVALFGKSPYRNVITNGLVLAEDGKKMSKKLQNYPDPMELADRVGVDAMRYYLLASPIIKGEDLNFSEKGVLELQRKNIGRLHNVLAMYELYANADTKPRDDSAHVLDRWIVARLGELIAEATYGFKNYELDRATRPITDFIDDLSVWYLRRSRDRIKGDDKEDVACALGTLRYVLRELALVMAPSMPFYAEYLWGRVKNEGDAESVHLARWPEAKDTDTDVLGEMKKTREIVSLALEQRAKANIKVRQPLASLYVKDIAMHDEYISLIKDEVNVRVVTPKINGEPHSFIFLNTEITPELKEEGDVREFMRHVQELRKKAGLEPRDHIMLTLQSSHEGEALTAAHEDAIKAGVGADGITYAQNDGEECRVGEHSYTVTIHKVG